MTIGNQIPDKTLYRSVLQSLTRKGTGSSRVTATVRSGEVTLTGAIAYEYERRPLLRSASSVPGVRRVIDQLRVEQRKKTWE
jgi:osmotically-inducible protein OsmY